MCIRGVPIARDQTHVSNVRRSIFYKTLFNSNIGANQYILYHNEQAVIDKNVDSNIIMLVWYFNITINYVVFCNEILIKYTRNNSLCQIIYFKPVRVMNNTKINNFSYSIANLLT